MPATFRVRQYGILIRAGYYITLSETRKATSHYKPLSSLLCCPALTSLSFNDPAGKVRLQKVLPEFGCCRSMV